MIIIWGTRHAGALTSVPQHVSAEIGIDPHMVNLSLGIHGRTDRLPPADIREFTTMCGHGVISPLRVCDIIRRVKKGKVTEWDGSVILAEPCACGIYNPHRSVELLHKTAPLYTVDRWKSERKNAKPPLTYLESINNLLALHSYHFFLDIFPSSRYGRLSSLTGQTNFEVTDDF